MAQFTWEEEKVEPKEVLLIYGGKGEGKTATSMGFEGKKYVISFDHKATRVKNSLYRGDENITILDGVKYFSHEKEKYLQSSVDTYNYILFLLDEIKKKADADWIIIDGLDILIEVAEMKMRADSNLKPFQGIANLSIWKDRKLNIRAIHEGAVGSAKKGVVYTTYAIARDQIIEDGQVVKRKETPRWLDYILYEVDTVIRMEYIHKKGKKSKFIATIKTSKLPKYPMDMEFNLTNSTLPNEITKLHGVEKKVSTEVSTFLGGE